MSLFKSREWWSANCGSGDEIFEGTHLCLASIPEAKTQLILVGSREGYLRVYAPLPKSAESKIDNSSDLLLETQLALPILAVQTGRFTNTDGIHVAILHPRKLRVMRLIVSCEGHGQIDSQGSLDVLYEHDLALHAFSLCVGPFWLCVQSLTDATLSFFENERTGIICRLPALTLLPSPLCYIPDTESFVVVDPAWNLQSYSYRSLANSTINQQQPVGTIKLLSDWEVELGEPALDIQQVGSFVVVLGERHLYCLKNSGSVLWARKLDYHPMCFALQTPPDHPDSLVILACSDANTLVVYKDNAVAWTSKLPITPLAIKIGSFESIPGLMVLLSESGELDISYMGTQQVQYSFCPPPQRPFSYKRGLQEIQQLKQKFSGPRKQEKTSRMDIELRLDPQLSQGYSDVTNQVIHVIKGQIRIVTESQSKEIHVVLRCGCSSLKVSPSSVCIQREHGKAWLPVQFEPTSSRRSAVSSLECKVSAVISGGESVSKKLILPLQLAMKISTPRREAMIKITLATDQPAVNLSSLFRDMSGVDESMSNAVALEHIGDGTVVSILASKSTNKYRLQSDSLAALALPVVELQRRLQLALPGLRISLDSTPPVVELWSLVELHFAAQNELQNGMTKLSQATRQFQVIQRGFHNKILHTKTSDATGSIAALQLAHEHVIYCIQQVEQAQGAMRDAVDLLESSIRCMLSIFESSKKDDRSIALLEQALLPVEQSDANQLWQKSVETKLNYLVRRWTSSGQHPTDNAKEFSMTSLKKTLFQVFEMLARGLIVNQ